MTKFLILFLTITSPAFAESESLSVILKAALQNSQKIQAAHDSEKIAKLRISLAHTGYMPTIYAEAIDSRGFSGSTGQLGIGGLMGSPYRSGWGYGLVATQPIYDFGRTSNASEHAEKEFDVQKANTELSENEVLKAAFETYLQCSLVRTQVDNWTDIEKLATLSKNEMGRFVRTGQRSIIEDLLAKTQVDEAISSKSTFDSHLSLIKKRLALLTGLDEKKLDCPLLSEFSVGDILTAQEKQNPLLKKAQLEKDAAEALVNEAKSEYRPRLVALASVGEVEDVRVVKRQNYAVGVGLIIPIFDANKTNVKVDQAKAQSAQKQNELGATQQSVDDTNAYFDELITSTSVQLKYLKIELSDSELALKNARERYFTLKGNLADLRETIRNLSRAKTSLFETQAQLFRAQGLKAIYNGVKF
jgi:outer membrane protein TolC